MQIRLANPRGFCAGVDRAIEIVERALDAFGAPVYVRHEVVHNRFVVDGLRARGAIFVEELSEVPDDATVISGSAAAGGALPRFISLPIPKAARPAAATSGGGVLPSCAWIAGKGCGHGTVANTKTGAQAPGADRMEVTRRDFVKTTAAGTSALLAQSALSQTAIPWRWMMSRFSWLR